MKNEKIKNIRRFHTTLMKKNKIIRTIITIHTYSKKKLSEAELKANISIFL